MIKTHLLAAMPLILSLTTPVAARDLHQQPANVIVDRQVAAPSWSAACMQDTGPTQCNEPMWVYGSPAYVSRFGKSY
jgi:hypothetical protein